MASSPVSGPCVTGPGPHSGSRVNVWSFGLRPRLPTGISAQGAAYSWRGQRAAPSSLQTSCSSRSRAGCSTCYHPPSGRRPARMPAPRDHPPTRRKKRPKTKPTAPGASPGPASEPDPGSRCPRPALSQLPGALVPCSGWGQALACNLAEPSFLVCTTGRHRGASVVRCSEVK